MKFIRYEPDDKPQVEAVEEEGRPFLRVTVPDPILGQKLALDADLLALSAAVVPAAAQPGRRRLFKVTAEPGRLLPGSPRQAEAGGLRGGRRVPVRNGPLSQAHIGDDQPGLRRRGPGGDPALAGHGHGLRLRVRGSRERLRIVRGVHRGLHVRRHRVLRHAATAKRPGSIPSSARATACATRSARRGPFR